VDSIRIGFVVGLMTAFGVVVNELTHGEVILTMTGWLKLLGG